MATKRELRTALTLSGEKEYTAGLNRVKFALGSVATEQKLLNSEYDAGDQSLERMARQQDILQRKLDQQKKRVELIAKAYNESAAKGEETAETTQKLGNELNIAQAAVNNTERELRELGVAMECVNGKTATFRQRMEEAGITADKVGGTMQKVGNRVAVLSTAIAGAVITKSVKGWTDLEDSMANVGTIADTAQVSMEELTTQVLAASDATGVAARDISSAVYQAISANVDTADSVGLVEQAAKAAKAGVADVTTVIDGSTSIINAWGVAAADTESVFDKLLKTQQRGKTTIGELSQSIGLVTGLAPSLNMTIDETLASVAALTMNGVNTSQALTGLRAVMSSILKPTAEARKEAERLGIDFSAAGLKSKGFTEFLAEIEEKTGGSEEALAKLFGSVQGLSEIMLLGGNAADDYADILSDLQGSAGTLDQMFAQRTSSASETMTRALNKANNAAIALGQSFAPVITALAEKAESFADAIRGMSSEEAANIVETTLWVAGISKGVSVLGGLIKNAKLITTALTAMNPAALAVAGSVAAIGAGIYGLSELKNVLAPAKLDFSIDESELENYKIPDTELNEFQVLAEAKLKITNQLSDWRESVVQWLNDGQKETPEQMEGYLSGIDTIIEGAFASIEETYNTKKKSLDDLLANGLITPEEHEESMNELDSQTAELKESLTTSSDAVHAYINKLVKNNRATTDEEIEELDRLLNELGLVTQKVLESNDAKQKVREGATKKVEAGLGTSEDRKLATEQIDIEYKADMSDLEAKRENIQTGINTLAADATEEELKAIAEQEEAVQKGFAEDADALNKARDVKYGELLRGEAKRLGVDAEELMEYWQLIQDGAETLDENVRSGLPVDGERAAKVGRYRELLESFGDLDIEGFKETMAAYYAGLENADDIDLTDSNAMLGEMIRLMSSTDELKDLPDDYGDIAEDTGKSFWQNLGDWLPSIQNTSKQISDAVLNATNDLKEFEKAANRVGNLRGGNLSASGIIDGVNNRVNGINALQSASARAVNQASAAGYADSTSAGSGVQTTVVNNINYTAGAGTMREARMLSQKLSGIQRNSLIGEGY